MLEEYGLDALDNKRPRLGTFSSSQFEYEDYATAVPLLP